ncbi:CNNM domain-containing protein [Halomonas sp.]|uniref:CNNM domain-containing protein n=1 Tax=Halomonas sp. TaxID=1486246 RepID=UPI003F8F7038
MVLLTIIVILTISASFLCSILEASLLSITPSYIAQLKEERPKLHKALDTLKANIDRPLAAILTLNTIANTAGATGIGAQVAAIFGDVYVAVASAVMTILILVFSEIIPKTLGANYWRRLAPFLPPILNTLMVVLMPFIWLSKMITQRLGEADEGIDVRSEIKVLARAGLEEKVMDNDETRTITNILNLHEIPVTKAMTPRAVSETVTPEMTVSAFDERFGKLSFTRYPVMDANEQALGYVHKLDVYHAEPGQTMQTLMHPMGTIADSASVEQVFTDMLTSRHHMRVIHDEHGTWLGIITLEDVIETILGQDIVDETDKIQNLRNHAKQRWLKQVTSDTPLH